MIAPYPMLKTSDESRPSRRAWSRVVNVLGPFLALAAVVLFFAITDSWMNGDKATFLTGRNWMTISSQTATVAV
ncbi:MAG: hypothetical protein FD138_2527, partial [Planctomycetota bacterium]